MIIGAPDTRANHHVCRVHEAAVEGAMHVVKLELRHAIIDVDGMKEHLAFPINRTRPAVVSSLTLAQHSATHVQLVALVTQNPYSSAKRT